MIYRLIIGYSGNERKEFSLPDYPKTLIIGRPTPQNSPDIPIKLQNISRKLAELKTAIINGYPVHSIKRSPEAVNRFRREVKDGDDQDMGDEFVLKDKETYLISNSSAWVQYLIKSDEETEIIKDENETLF